MRQRLGNPNVQARAGLLGGNIDLAVKAMRKVKFFEKSDERILVTKTVKLKGVPYSLCALKSRACPFFNSISHISKLPLFRTTKFMDKLSKIILLCPRRSPFSQSMKGVKYFLNSSTSHFSQACLI